MSAPAGKLRRIYFVRHGETVCNVGSLMQGPDDVLSDLGRQQAEDLGKRLKNISFESLVSSDYIRAEETAKIISFHTGHQLTPSPLFRETKAPSSLLGLSYADEKVRAYRQRMRDNLHDEGWKTEDEESVRDVRLRAKDAFAFAAAQTGDVVVVTHGHILKHIIFHVVFGDDMPAHVMERGIRRMKSTNTGITVFQEQPHGDWWNLLAWNDHAHLG